MKTKEELSALKEEVEAVSKKLAELTEDELTEVSGGLGGCCGFLSDIQKNSGNGSNEKLGDNVAIFPGISAFP